MAQGLSVGRLIRTSVTLSPIAAARRGFGVLLVMGDSAVITVDEKYRTYTTLESVATDFGTTAPEYYAAALYFGQTPRPSTLMIGRWASSAVAGFIKGGALSASQQLAAAWTPVTAGKFKMAFDGGAVTEYGPCDFSAVTNMNGVAAIIDTAITGDGNCTWNGSSLVIESATTGATSSVSYATAPSTGTDISTQIKMTSATYSLKSAGSAAKTPVESLEILANASALWFGSMFAATASITDDQYKDCAALVEGLDIERIFAVTSSDAGCIDPASTTDIAYELKALAYKRTFVQYSSQNPYAAASFYGRAFSVNFSANRSTITMMYKQEPGVVAEYLTETQAQALKDKNCNVYVNYVNDTAIIQYGTMASGAYFDEIHGLSWFKDALQNAEYNLLYTSKTKIPQTDAGQNQLINTAVSVCNEAVNNGLVAPGTWNADGFGQLEQGQYLKTGYYIYTPPIALQNQVTREQRIAPPLQIALKLAGAFQELDIIVDVNR